MRLALIIGASLILAPSLFAQTIALDVATSKGLTAPLKQALSAKGTPLKLKAKSLDENWRRFRPGNAIQADLGKIDPDEYSVDASFVTRNETLKVGGKTYLIAYRDGFAFLGLSQIEAFRLRAVEDRLETSDGYVRLFSEQTLQLCLLDVAAIGDLIGKRAFDAKIDLIQLPNPDESEESIEKRAQLRGDAVNQRVTSDLRQIGLALAMSAENYDQEMPPMRSAQSMAEIKRASGVEPTAPEFDDFHTAQQALLPYAKVAEIFAHPITREIYRPNVNVSRRPFFLLDPADRVIAFYEASPAKDGRRAVLYLDGHVKRELETYWPTIRAASDAIAPPFRNAKRIVKAEVKPDMWVLVPKIKTALGANRAMRGSAIDVDGIGDLNQIILRGTTSSKAQKTLAESTAKKNAPGVRIINQLVIKSN